MRKTGWGRNGVRRGIGVALVTATGSLAGAGVAQAAITITGPTPVNEGTANAALRFTVTRPGQLLASSASVRFRVTGGTATPGSDYTPLNPPSRTLDMSTGALFGAAEQTVDVPILNDTLYEGVDNETVSVTIDNANGDTISGDGTATGEIVDNDPKPKVSIGAGSGPEGTGAPGAIALPVVLSAVSGRAVSVPYTVTAGTATSPEDIDATGGTLEIPAGAAGGTINVATVGDTLDEPDEGFTVTLGAPPVTQAELLAAEATGTVVNDDTPSVAVAGVALAEGTSATPTAFQFPVTLSNASTRAVSVRVTTANVQATTPADYGAIDEVVTFPPGDTGQVVTVPVVADAADEPDEAFAVNLSEPAGLTIGTGAALGAILDDDAGPAGGTGTGGGGSGTGTGTTVGTLTPVTPGSGAAPGPPTPAPGAGAADRTPPLVRLAALRVRRPASVQVRVTCPATETRCTGTVSVFNVVVRKAKNKALRREARIARGRYALAGGASRTVTMKLSTAGRRLLTTAKRFRARAFGVSRDAAGNIGTGTLTATLKR